MKYFLGFFLFGFLFFTCSKDKVPPLSTEIMLQKRAALLPELNEISGVVFKNKTTVYAHNDSGNEALIYEVSLVEKKINRTIKITNAANLDWEDMAQDEQYIYISDTGNNSGQRTDLKILKTLKTEVESQDSVVAQMIEFSYPDQVDFTPSSHHDFDAEALISFGNQLFIFSKNRGNLKTKLYSLPKTPGNYIANLKDEFNVDGWITGASINDDKNVIALLGHSPDVFKTFVWLFYDYAGEDVFSGKNKKIDLAITAQMEAITFGQGNILYFTHESEQGNEVQFFYELDVSGYLED